MSKYTPRLLALSKNLQSNQAILISDIHDMYYLTGFETLVPNEREGYVVLTKKATSVVHASFTPVTKLPDVMYLMGCAGKQGNANFKSIFSEQKIDTLFIDFSTLTVAEHINIAEISDLEIKELNRENIWKLRMVKDEAEQESMLRACQITHDAFEATREQLKPGLTEIAVKHLLEHELRSRGADQTAFPTIVAFDTHTALPHYQPSDTKLTENSAVMIDFGAKYDFYCADMTRTFWFGNEPDPLFITIKEIVDRAYQSALKYLRDGKNDHTAQGVDEAARSIITDAGYSKEFIHTTGHGVGLDIHEPPSLNWTNTESLVPGMTITVEPGIYLPGKFGVRYENSVLILEDGVVEMTNIDEKPITLN